MFNALPRCSNHFIRRAIVTVVLSTAIPLAASASPPPSHHAPETNSMTIKLSDLDLTTPQGLQEARTRLIKAAQHLCSRWADSRKVDDSASYALCTQETVANALKNLPMTALNARN